MRKSLHPFPETKKLSVLIAEGAGKMSSNSTYSSFLIFLITLTFIGGGVNGLWLGENNKFVPCMFMLFITLFTSAGFVRFGSVLGALGIFKFTSTDSENKGDSMVGS